jgi:type IV secretory pathway VirB4 component
MTDETEIRGLYLEHDTPVVLTSYGLDLGTEVLGCLKLQRLGTQPLTYLDFSLLREALPAPFEIHFAAQKIPGIEAQMLLSRRSNQESTSHGSVAQAKYQETQSALEEIELHGTELFKFELAIMLRRSSEAELRTAISRSLLELRRLGDFRQETHGALAAFIATIPGSDFHYTLIERDAALGCFAPVTARSEMSIPSIAPGAMAYHREDCSLSMFDLFHPRYESFSTLIIGQPGLGKSVFANTLLRCLLNDPKSRVILVDVKGSHIHTTRRLNGVVNNVSLDSPSGINPLSELRSDSSRDELEIVSSFIKQLMLNENELDLPIKESFQVEELIKAYAATSPKSPSIDDFIKFASDRVPRVEHLSRWRSDTLHGNIFKQSNSKELSNLNYYNFSQIMTASSKSVSTGVLAAVMAKFSFELLRKRPDEKLYFIADETPFFVQHCFQSFRLLMKNVRKLNGSLILIAQDHSDLVVSGDPSLLNNAATKVLFSTDGERSQYRERLRLTERDMETLSHLRGEKGVYSKFLLVDGLGSRVGVLNLSRDEYLFSSTSANDHHRAECLRKVVPNLSETDALHLLSHIPKSTEIGSVL